MQATGTYDYNKLTREAAKGRLQLELNGRIRVLCGVRLVRSVEHLALRE
jgi:hypothetical protein